MNESIEPTPNSIGDANSDGVSEEVEVAGHIIDSLILPKILDEITALGGSFEISDINVGHKRNDPSYARLRVVASDDEKLTAILTSIGQHGAVAVAIEDCRFKAADLDGCFPEGFYCTTNQATELRLNSNWITVDKQEMDCGVKVDTQAETAMCIPMLDVMRGDMIAIGHRGLRVKPLQRDTQKSDAFSFMNSTVSSEKPKGVTVREIAAEMQRAKSGDGRILIVAGPAVVHTGSRDHFSALIRGGFINVVFAGNALATHDIEQTFFGTSLGISMQHGGSIEEGHEHHLRAINRIRRTGGIRQAVDQGVLRSGIMYDCVKAHIPYLLAGSIRDDGPLPDVVTDVVDAQQKMREMSQGVTFCLMIATTLHSIAVGNLLPAKVKVVCVDINPATVTKLADRGTFQTIGLVTDVEPFLRVLVDELNVNS